MREHKRPEMGSDDHEQIHTHIRTINMETFLLILITLNCSHKI